MAADRALPARRWLGSETNRRTESKAHTGSIARRKGKTVGLLFVVTRSSVLSVALQPHPLSEGRMSEQTTRGDA